MNLFSLRTILELGLLCGATFFIFRRPIVGLALFLFVITAWISLQRFNPYVYVQLHLTRLVAIITFVALISKVINGKARLSAPLQNWLMVSLLGLMCLSRGRLRLSLDDQSISDFAKVTLVYFMVTSVVDSKEKLRYALWGIIAGLTLEAWTAYNNLRTGELSLAVPIWWMDKNDFAVSLVMGIPLAVTFFLNEKWGVKRVLLMGSLALLLLTVLRAYSRGGYIGLFIVLLITLIRLLVKKEWRTSMVFFIPLLLYIFVVRTPARTWERMTSLQYYEQDISVQSRFAFWRAGIKMMALNPILGIGAGKFSEEVMAYIPPEVERVKGRAPHNMFILIGAENGIPALFVWLLLLIKTLFDSIYVAKFTPRDPRASPLIEMEFALIAGLTGWLICGFFISPIYRATPHAFIALVAASKNILYREMEKLEEESNTHQEKESSETSIE